MSCRTTGILRWIRAPVVLAPVKLFRKIPACCVKKLVVYASPYLYV
jgi:hypothetical protein